MIGLVIAAHRNRIVVEDESRKTISCRTDRRTSSVVVGDEVQWCEERAGHGRIETVLPRRSLLSRSTPGGTTRAVAANIDLVLIVIAPRPSYSTRLLDRYLVVAEYSGLRAAVAFNKTDLLSAQSRETVRAELAVYEQLGYPVYWTNAKSEHGLADLEALWKDRVSVLVGQSGVGKSSILRALSPESNIEVGELSTRGDLGRHTTSTSKLYRTARGGRIIDTPGVLDFALWHIPEEALDRCFPEFEALAADCRFANCQHLQEPDCAVAAAAGNGDITPQRFESYQAMRLTQR